MGDSALDPTGALLAAVQRSTRAVTLLGGGLGMFGVIIQVTGVADDLYVWGLIPVPLFMIILGPLAVIVTFVRAAEFKALEFGLTDVGVRSRDALIRWEDVAEVYLGGTTYLAEGLIRSAEERHLRVVAKDGREIELSLRLFGRMSPESSRALASIVGALLRRVGDRQRTELEACASATRCGSAPTGSPKASATRPRSRSPGCAGSSATTAASRCATSTRSSDSARARWG